MKLLVDHNLPPVMARAVHLLVQKDGHEVAALRDRFAPDSADIEWLGQLGMEGGWSILSLDQMILRRPAERLALHRARVTAYFLAPGWSKLANLEKTARLLLWWPKLLQASALMQTGGVYELPINAGSSIRPLRLG